MVQLSKRQVKPEVELKMFKLLFDVIGRQKDNIHFTGIINGVFSPIEKLMIAKRVSILFLLIKKVEWTTICDVLKVSPSSVSKCQMILLNNDEIIDTLRVLIKQTEMKIFFEEIFSAFFGPGTAYTNWKKGWERKRKLELSKTEIL